MNDEVVFFLRVEDLVHRAIVGGQRPSVSHLSAPFRVEGRTVEHGLNKGLFLGRDLPVAQQGDGGFCVVVANELSRSVAFAHHLPVVGGDFSGLPGAVFLGVEEGLEPSFIDVQFLFARDEGGQVDREPKGVVQLKHHVAGQGVAGFHARCGGSEAFDAGGQRAKEGLFFLLNDLFDEPSLGLEFREGLGHLAVQDVHELVNEGLVHAQEGRAVPHRPTQDATDDVARPRVGWELTVGNGKRHGTHVVGNDPKGDGLLAVVLGVGLATGLRDGVEKRREDVGVVVRRHTLHRHREALEAHARVDVLVGKGHKGAVRHAVELHEDEVPNLNDLGVVFVDHRAAVDFGAFFVAAQVDVDFRARTTGAGFAHLPEVVLFARVENAVFGHVLAPLFSGFEVRLQAVAFVSTKHRDVQAVLVESVAVGQQFPRPVDGLCFEVVSKRPVAQHLKQGVVVGVDAHFFQVVVLAADAKALLGVGNPSMLHRLVAQEQILERIHPCVDEHQGRIVLHDHGGRGHDLVSFFLEKIQKSLSNAP